MRYFEKGVKKDYIFHAGGFGDAGPFVGVELHRIELLVEIVVFLDRRLRAARPTVAGGVKIPSCGGLKFPCSRIFTIFRGNAENVATMAVQAARDDLNLLEVR